MVDFFFALSSLQLFGCKITHYFRNFQEKAGKKENERVPAARFSKFVHSGIVYS